MASGGATEVPLGSGEAVPGDAALQHRPWQGRWRLSSVGDTLENGLEDAGFERAPWLAVALAAGVAAWFVLDAPWQWAAAIGAGLLLALTGWHWTTQEERVRLGMASIGLGLAFALGVGLIWSRSAVVGAEAFEYPRVIQFNGQILDREDQPSRDRIRLVLAMRDAETGQARKVRVNLDAEDARDTYVEGAVVRLRARLMPPAPPMVPGAYDFARAAWFMGLAGTGSVIGPVDLVSPAPPNSDPISALQRILSAHVRANVSGSEGTIAAAFASGDRGAIAERDEEAMRDSGLTHLLSISGLHVSAVIAGAYFLAIKLLALWPWLALRVRLPVVAAGIGALAGIGYTLLTGAEVPTVRSCAAALLVLGALALGRQALSLRMVALAAAFVLFLWPESLAGPSFQMSFSAVLAIVALHNCDPVKEFLAAREESWLARTARRGTMLLVTGLVIEFALMPIVLFHFHRAGVYGAFANVVAIPLVTFVSMPLIALALLLDLVGLGKPVWWLAEFSLDQLLDIAHWTSAQPGAVKLLPQMSYATFAMFVTGGLWLALWKGRKRALGLVPAAIGTAMMIATPVPDILISDDGRHVGIAGEDRRLLMLRESRSDYARENLQEMAGTSGDVVPLADWEGAECSRDFCVIAIERGGRTWQILMARSRDLVSERALSAACERADIVVADRYLPRSCLPRWLKADRRTLSESGGLAIVLADETITRVADTQGQHGWWRGRTEGFGGGNPR
ncbi:ComEC/Rec2 family competence protein [Qipengyuania sp. DSG2-2]|uniref:ComEC/Rec2 family competence protein n=1 Tax=Qipengyuania sp. DGS2-2 TaxID=3349631 RepID=UPI0036D3A008